MVAAQAIVPPCMPDTAAFTLHKQELNAVGGPLDPAEYHKMHALERSYWWFQGRRTVILTVLDQFLCRLKALPASPDELKFLDLGCGTGMLLEDLKTRGKAVGLDFSPIALSYCRERNLAALGRADVGYLPIRTQSVDVVTALDLVEHVRDDRALLGEIYRVLKPGGMVLMTVPAHKALWGPHDRALHHFRRYEKEEFLRLVNDIGLHPLKYTYTVATAYLPAMVYRRTKRMIVRADAPPRTDEFPLPGFVNSTLRTIMNCEARYLQKRNLPFGLSLLCIASRPADTP